MKVKRKLITGLVVLGLVVPLAGFLPVQEEESFRQTAAEIKLNNLLNGLYLSSEQIVGMLPILREAQDEIQVMRDGIGAINEELAGPMEVLLEAVRQDQDAPEEVTREVYRLKEAKKELMEKHRIAMEALGKAVHGILTENQLVLLKEYKPCLVPPKHGKGSRIGQAGGADPIMRLLEHVREMPEEEYQEKLGRIMRRHEKKTREHFGPDADLEAEREKFLAALEEVRSMTDIDFQVEVEEIAATLKPPTLGPLARSKGRKRAFARIFFSPELIPILEERLEAMKSGETGSS